MDLYLNVWFHLYSALFLSFSLKDFESIICSVPILSFFPRTLTIQFVIIYSFAWVPL